MLEDMRIENIRVALGNARGYGVSMYAQITTGADAKGYTQNPLKTLYFTFSETLGISR